MIRTLVLTVRAKGTWHKEQQILQVPDHSRLAPLDLRRAAFVKKTMTVDFENGLQKSVALSKPSEALAVAQTPVDVVKNVLRIPIEAFGQQTEEADAETKLIEANTKNVEAQAKLADALDKLRKAGSATGGTDGPE